MRCLYDGVHPCGKCPACLANRQRAFMFRLDQEKENCKFYFWITLQYSDEYVPRIKDSHLSDIAEDPNEMCFSKEHCRQFFERLRKRYCKKNGSTFKHFLVCEYGPNSTHRPHYHLLLMVYNDLDLATNFHIRKEMREYIIHDAWDYGHVTEKSFHGRVLAYLTKYCTKPELLGQNHTMKPFTLISRGIGLCLLDKIPEKQKSQMIENLDFTYRYGSGKIQLPRYYVDRILPHSLEDLRKATPTKYLKRRSSWSEFDRISDIRRRLAEKQSVLSKAYGIKREDEDYIQRKDRIDYELSKFKSKIKMRKDL